MTAAVAVPTRLTIDWAHRRLGWPSPEQILHPDGAGPAVFARLVEDKIGQELRRRPDVGSDGVRVGVLLPNPESDDTEAPVAIVCEFAREVDPATLREAHRLAWNFSRSPLLVTIEPNLLRAWTCYVGPSRDAEKLPDAEIDLARITAPEMSAAAQAAAALHWVQLVSGAFFERHRSLFTIERRADQTLLENLTFIRDRLCTVHEIDPDTVHDLLARIIFIQFLFDRKDSSGQAALNPERLAELHESLEPSNRYRLSRRYASLAEILTSHTDTYAFFRWLNEKFNGDLFPGKGKTPDDRESEWREEMRKVRPPALLDLAAFVSGSEKLATGVLYLWPQYAFDAIPLEFISSIYEEFVQGTRDDEDPEETGAKEGEEQVVPAQVDAFEAAPLATEVERKRTGVHYTRSHLVDFVLDAVLPWEGTEWNLRVLDPACGSGIFLVKAFQRLVHRWRSAHQERSIEAEDLKQLLANNLFGVDKDRHAARVASFSLYLALCDELDPKEVWATVKFPVLRGHSIIAADFFREDVPGFRTGADAGTYDLVVGNAPWGKKSTTPLSAAWAKENEWPVIYRNIGPLFLAKAARLGRHSGCVAMLQPASALLFNRSGNAVRMRQRLFTNYSVEEVVNFAALRTTLFVNAGAPTCSIVFRPVPPEGAPIVYACPKPTGTAQDDYRITIEEYDLHSIQPHEAASDSWVWSALMWGGPRDLELVHRLSRAPTLAKLKKGGQVKTREGIIRGKSKRREQEILAGKRIMGKQFPSETFRPGTDFLRLHADRLEVNRDLYTDASASTDFSAFALPQLILKQSWLKDRGRFAAALVESSKGEAVLCTQSYVTVHTPRSEDRPYLESACLSYNSTLSVYYLLLTSGRIAFERAETLVEELLPVPLPDPGPDLLEGVRTLEDVDRRVFDRLRLKAPERVLVEDLIAYTLPDYKGATRSSYRSSKPSPGRRRTAREAEDGTPEPELTAYCEYLLKVLEAGFGATSASATVFQGPKDARLPLRMVAVHLDWSERPERVEIVGMEASPLVERLEQLDRLLDRADPSAGGAFYRRTARVYDFFEAAGRRIPTIYLIKPDQVRYWTRSAGLRDGDRVAADALLWAESAAVVPEPLHG
ncbi:MAG: N-6 DNA methylase [Gemmatimonadota bacterium]